MQAINPVLSGADMSDNAVWWSTGIEIEDHAVSNSSVSEMHPGGAHMGTTSVNT